MWLLSDRFAIFWRDGRLGNLLEILVNCYLVLTHTPPSVEWPTRSWIFRCGGQRGVTITIPLKYNNIFYAVVGFMQDHAKASWLSFWSFEVARWGRALAIIATRRWESGLVEQRLTRNALIINQYKGTPEETRWRWVRKGTDGLMSVWDSGK